MNKRQHDRLVEQMLEAAGYEGREQPAGDVAEQPRKAIAEGNPRRSLRGAVDADQLEDVVVGSLGEVDDFIREQVDVDDADELTGAVDDREREQSPGREVLAGNQHGRPVRDRDHVVFHDVAHGLVGRGRDQPARRHDPDELFGVVDDIEVMNRTRVRRGSDAIERLGNRVIGLEDDERRLGQRQDRLVQLRGRQGGGRHALHDSSKHDVKGRSPDIRSSSREARRAVAARSRSRRRSSGLRHPERSGR